MSIRSFRTRALSSLLILVSLAFSLLSACGKGNASFCTSPPCQIGPRPAFLYATTDTGQVLTLAIDQQSGGLGTPVSVSGPTVSLGIAASGFGFLYVSDFQNAQLNAYSINSTNGTLSPLSGSPFSTGSFSLPVGLAASRDGASVS